MNISELNQALHEIADEVTDDSRTRLASVTRRVETARRSRIAATIVTTCAALAALVLLPNWGVLPGSHSAPPAHRTPFGSLATVRDGDYLIYSDAGGVRLLESGVGAAGAHTVRLAVTPRTGNLGWTQPCQESGADQLQYHLMVNGREIPSAALESRRYTGAETLSDLNTSCDDAGSPMQVERRLSNSPKGNIGAWQRMGVQPGQRAVFELRVTATDDRAGREALAQAMPMLAVFEMPRHAVRTHGMWVERHIVDPPAAEGAFKLVRRSFVTLEPGSTQLSVPVPDKGEQVYVRTFVRNGEESGVTLSEGLPTRNELDSSVSRWSVEKSIAAGPSTVHAALASVPEGARDHVLVEILVYVRYL